MPGLRTDVSPSGASLYFLSVQTRVPLKFGSETLTTVICARVGLTVQGRDGRRATGWGETPLSVQWVWPGALSFGERQDALLAFCRRLAGAWASFACWGHPLEVGYRFQQQVLVEQLRCFNAERSDREAMPYLAALVCCSLFDLALHDAYGVLHGLPTYQTYGREWMNQDLAAYLAPAAGAGVDFHGRYPSDFLVQPPPTHLVAWHLVGGKDALTSGDLDGSEPDDGYPLLLHDWIRRDGLTCLKVKLRGDDMPWDYARLLAVGRIALEEGCRWLSADFNCTVTDPAYVTAILDRLLAEEPHLYGMLLYVEQPFPYELEQHLLDVHAVSARKPLFLDESAHDWRLVRLGHSLGWTGVALKTCKTQTGALLSLCWAKAHGMTLMVQDLTNPMLAQIPHVLLAAHAGTIMGVETNAMQFYPEASLPEAAVHPGLYCRRHGTVTLDTLGGPGFGYHLERIERTLPAPDTVAGEGASQERKPRMSATVAFTVFTKPWKLPVAELGPFVKGLGFAGVELPVRPGYPVNPENAATELPRAARTLAEAGLKIISVAGSTDEATVAACGAAGVPILRVMAPIAKDRGYLEQEAQYLRQFDALLPALEREQVTLGIQHHTGRFVTNAAGLRRLVERYNPRQIAAVWDPAHCALSGELPELAIDLLWSHLCLVNLKNGFWRRTNGPEAEVAQYGHYWTEGRQGQCSWPAVATLLKQRGYAGYVCLCAEYSNGDDVNRLIANDLAFASTLFA